jgi:hypothetical protein
VKCGSSTCWFSVPRDEALHNLDARVNRADGASRTTYVAK